MMKFYLYGLMLVSIASVCVGADFFISVELGRENLYPIQDAEYLKTILPQRRDLFNEMIIAQKQGKTDWYDFDIYAESSDEKIVSARFYKPGDSTPIPLKPETGDDDFYFDSDESVPARIYSSPEELAVDFPPGIYKVEITFRSGIITREINVPTYDSDSFPDHVDISLSENAQKQLVFNWSAAENAHFYNVTVSEIRKNIDEFYDEDYFSIYYPQDRYDELGISKSGGDYEIELFMLSNSDWYDDYTVIFCGNETLFSFKNPPAAKQNDITKSTVAAGKSVGVGDISFSGTLDAIEADFLMAMGDIVEVFIDSDLMPGDISFQFPINGSSFKKGKYNYSDSSKGSSYAFSCDTKTGKMAFSAKNVNLSGMECPIYVTVTIGSDYKANLQLDEVVVNGTKLCPLQLMQGVKNSLTVTKSKVKYGKDDLSDTFTAQGTFTIDGNYDMYRDLVVTLGSQSLHVPGDKFDVKNDIVSCKGARSNEGLIVDAKFDFLKCTYSIVVKNASIAQSGTVDFGVDCFGVGIYGFAMVNIPPKP